MFIIIHDNVSAMFIQHDRIDYLLLRRNLNRIECV